tara:strand:- start:2210 stop:3097 length:888 start_codon:yes stop_codon:yes gene_type:complete
MSNVAFISDLFIDETVGGGELNDYELIQLLLDRGHKVYRLKSKNVSVELLTELINEDLSTNFIISNFRLLSEESKRFLYSPTFKKGQLRYMIYEHDHKYLKTRNPAAYKDFKAPREDLINYEFYQNAIAVLCQSQFHADIVKLNLGFDNIVSLGGNLWSTETLDFLEEQSTQEKHPDKYSVMDSHIPHKNTAEAAAYCKYKDLDYELIPPQPPLDFLHQLGKNEKLVFFPKTPETLSRIVVEARMMGMTVVANKNIGATKEPWFKFKGKELIDVMREKRKEIPERIIEMFNGEPL